MREPQPRRRVIVDENDARQEDTFRESLAAPVARPVGYERSGYFTATNIVYVLFGILESILALRFLFLLFGASTANSFVNFIYAVSEPFLAPFYGIFGSIDIAGSIAVFDGSTLLAMIVYGLLAWVIIRLIAALSDRPV